MEEHRNQAAVRIARALKLPLVATNGVNYATAYEREVMDVLTSIRHHSTLDTAGRLLSLNAERHLRSPREMQELFCDLPEAVTNTTELSARLTYTMSDLGYRFPSYPVPDGETMQAFLEKRVEEGVRERYLPKRDPKLFRESPTTSSTRTGADWATGTGGIFPDRLGHRAVLPAGRDSRSRAGIGGEQCGLLCARPYGD